MTGAMATQRTLQNTEMLDFELTTGYQAIPLCEVRRMFNTLPRGHRIRVFLLVAFATGGRLDSLIGIKGGNFSKDVLVYYETKNQAHRPVRIPPKMLEEINEYIKAHGLQYRRLWHCQYDNIRRKFNQFVRPVLGEAWRERRPRSEEMAVQRCCYNIRGLRTTVGTIAYSYYRRVYGDAVALSRTCKWMGHTSKYITADHYIKNLVDIGLERWPDIPMLQLLDLVVYGCYQQHLEEYGACRQKKVFEHESYFNEPRGERTNQMVR